MSYVSIRFQIEGEEIPLQAKTNEKMKDLIQKVETQINKNIKNYKFLYRGINIDLNSKLDEVLKEEDSDIVIVGIKKDNQNNFIRSNFVNCPVCRKQCIITMDSYKIKLGGCDNIRKDKESIYLLEEFENYFKSNQIIDQSQIKCEMPNCDNYKSQTYGNKFYKCYTCKKKICPLCINKHDNNHDYMDYDESIFYCETHFKEKYLSYCNNCHKNICLLCESAHKGHDSEKFSNLITE